MNREIKFQVWNGEQMVSPDYIDRDGVAWWKENSIPTSSQKVMQYTTCKDMDGEELWDGDIVEAHDNRGEIYWSDLGMWAIRWKGPTASVFNEQLWVVCNGILRIKKIGNRYENPELATT